MCDPFVRGGGLPAAVSAREPYPARRNFGARRRALRIVVSLVTLLTLLSTLFLPSPVLAADGAITGQIVGKNGATNLAGTPVTLTIATISGGQPNERTVNADAEGRFRFDAVTISGDAVYLLKVVYEGGNYFREVEFAAGVATVDSGTIDVYPAVRGEGSFYFPRMNTLMTATDQTGAQIVETGGYLNDTDKAYIGPVGAQDATVVRFGLPVDAFNLDPAQGLNRDTLVSLNQPPLIGFATIEAVTPGDHQFAYIYQMQSQNGTISIDRTFPYRTDLYTMYLPTSVRLDSNNSAVLVRDSGVQQLQNGQQFRVFTATNIPAGARLTIRLSNLPTVQTDRNPLLPALMVFMFLIGVGLIIVYGRQRGRSAVATAAQRQIKTVPGGSATPRGPQPRLGDDRSTDELAARKDELVLALVELDERFESGDLAEEEYRRQRRDRKNELVATLRALERREGQPVASGTGRARP